jgi:ATP synthase protein I
MAGFGRPRGIVAFFWRSLEPAGNPKRKREAVVVADDWRAMPLILLAQAGVCLGAGAVGWVWLGKTAAVSALLGGSVAVVPNAFLAARLLASRATAQALLRAAWIGELSKLALTAAGFIAIFALVRPVSAPAVFAGFIAVQLVVFGALLYGNGAPKQASRKD